GFDPHGAAVGAGPVAFRAELFDPCRHLEELRPDIIISRHVLEHLTNPLGFLQRIALVATLQKREVLSYFEVPCIENTLANQRTVDFYYEHSSQFTTESFTRMLKRCASAIEEIGHGYEREVIYGFTKLGQNSGEHQIEIVRQAEEFHTVTGESLTIIQDQLAKILASGRSVAVWGGTGKSAAFICRYGLDRQRFPVVVDSDPDKVGTFVPGTGQVIRFRDYLKEHPVDVLIIPPQWRAGDILAEMREQQIVAASILIEHQGRLVSLVKED
ncbi:MAG TPA: methyltransferase domain-containing protein, partial [Dongiaceae bacterium]|nr:methyltransferase domain-containing protein [Dongiaceae bacterium]